jgi:putative 4-mercaptohistidine N1-methyltranferase
VAKSSYYETDRGASEYLLLHFGASQQLLPPELAGCPALNFPARCVTECLDLRDLPPTARALDLGCAVGRASFELAARCAEVVGIDYSQTFISIARHLRRYGSFAFKVVDEGELTYTARAVVPAAIDRKRVRFERGDAMHLRRGLGAFDVVLMANLIDRLRDPAKCLKQLPGLVQPGGRLVITSPYTWLAQYTPRENWLGGFRRKGRPIKTFDALKKVLWPDFDLVLRRDLPFVIREHARKFQLGIAQATVWRARGT